MELGLVREIGAKLCWPGSHPAGAWIYNAVKLVLDARGINPLIKQFYPGGCGRMMPPTCSPQGLPPAREPPAVHPLLAGLKLNKFRNLKLAAPACRKAT